MTEDDEDLSDVSLLPHELYLPLAFKRSDPDSSIDWAHRTKRSTVTWKFLTMVFTMKMTTDDNNDDEAVEEGEDG